MRGFGRCLATGAVLVLAPAMAHAQPATPSPLPGDVTAPANAGQRALTVGLRPSRSTLRLYAKTCAAAPCPLEPLPAQPLLRLPDLGATTQARLTVLPIGAGRHLIHVDAGTGASQWQALVAAPLQAGDTPRVLWQGATPNPLPAGAESAAALQITSPAKDGTVRVLVGDRRPDLTLCGRPSLLSPRVVYERDLQLRPVKLQRLDSGERAQAQQLSATRANEDASAPLARLLVATGASSGFGSPGALTDGAPDTFWSEARGAEGRGEFVVMRAPSDVPIVELSFVVRPAHAQVEHGASPRSFFVATDDRLLAISLPEDAWQHPAARYVVRPEPPLRTSCLSLVLDEAFVRGDKQARVTLSEVTAYSAFDGQLDHAGLAAALDGPEEQGRAAAAVLMRGGDAATLAVAAQYAKLDPAARMLALQVLDAAPCRLSAPVFAARLGSVAHAERKHARDRVRRCGHRAVDALVSLVQQGAGCAEGYEDPAQCEASRRAMADKRLDRDRLAALDELASIAPARAVEFISPELPRSGRNLRASLRKYLARAAQRPAGLEAIGARLADPALHKLAVVELLRSVAAHVQGVHAQAGAAFARVAAADNDVNLRYLLLQPAAGLARVGDGRGVAYLRERMRNDREPMVRTRAAELAQGIEPLHPVLMQALEDENVRVRDAATRSLSGLPEAATTLVRRLQLDDWPMVRVSAARALATAGRSREVDERLAAALGDASPTVRAWVATALGTRGATQYAEALRALADAPDEKVQVRIAAVHALGRMCDQEASELLTVFARRARDPYSPEAASGLGSAAVAALGRIHPGDLAARLQPLLTEGSPPLVRAAAQAALAETRGCDAIPAK